jgi:hypothetical protein
MRVKRAVCVTQAVEYILASTKPKFKAQYHQKQNKRPNITSLLARMWRKGNPLYC